MKIRKRKKVIIDCDPGCDDALALMYACGMPQLEVLAVTTCCGNVSVQKCTQNARGILNLIGASHIPVVRGEKKPLLRDLNKAAVHGPSGLGNLKLNSKSGFHTGAAKRICELARRHPHQISLLAMAPLTNIAKAMEFDSTGFKLIKELIILGGSVHAPGNKGPVAEFNFYVDPEAACRVLHSGLPIRLVVLDACYPITLSMQEFAVIRNAKLRSVLNDLLEPYIEGNWKAEGIQGAIMYDPLVIYSALFPNRFREYAYRATVESDGVYTRGMLVVDRRLQVKKAPNISVIERIGLKGFRRSFFQALNRLSIAVTTDPD